MKKIFSIFSAAALLFLGVACNPEEKVELDQSECTAPVLLNYSVDGGIRAEFTPGTLNVNSAFTKHTLAIVKYNGAAVSQNITSKETVGAGSSTLEAAVKDISRACVKLGAAEGELVSLEIAVRALFNTSLSYGGVDSEGVIPVEGYEVVIPAVVGSPYKEYTEKSDWSLIGAMSAYGINWDGDLNMWTDGQGNHVAAHVTLKAGDEVKFRKDQKWDVNFGGTFGSLDTEFAVEQGGANIVIAQDGVYDLFLYAESAKAMISAAYDPLAAYTEASTWSVIGDITGHGISWDKDIAMITDGANHVAVGVSLDADDEFKFRKDAGWAVNLGGTFGSLDTEFAVNQDGANIKVGTAGVYDLYVNTETNMAKVTETAGLKVSAKIGADDPGDDPGDQPVEVTGWNIIGLNDDWNNDILATEDNGVWTAYITAEADTEFKWRKDGGWDADFGGTMAAFGEPFAAVAGGGNIAIPAGFFKVVLDLTDEAAPTITIYNDFELYSLIGDFNGWGADVDLKETESGIWVSPATALTTGGFKIRSGHDWSLSWGGTLAELGVAFDAISDNGPNIVVPEDGEYIVTFDKPNLKITVEPALPANTWSLIGVNGDWNNDIFMTELMPGLWMSPEVEINDAGWKVRFNHGWDVNRGSSAIHLAGEFGKAVPGGENIPITGKFKVYYNANNETIGTLVWGVVGSVASIPGFSWNNDIPMNLASDGKWYSIPITLAEGDEIKIRRGAAWDENYGGTFGEANAAFAAVGGGDNIKAVGTYMVVYDPAAGTLELNNQFWGLIGNFNGWAADKYMLYTGSTWEAYGQTLDGGWKIRQGADWAVNRGGVFAAQGEPFEAVPGGGDINVGELSGFDVIYNPAAETITVQ